MQAKSYSERKVARSEVLRSEILPRVQELHKLIQTQEVPGLDGFQTGLKSVPVISHELVLLGELLMSYKHHEVG